MDRPRAIRVPFSGSLISTFLGQVPILTSTPKLTGLYHDASLSNHEEYFEQAAAGEDRLSRSLF